MKKDLKKINQFHQEHATMCATGSTDYYNTEDFRKHLENSPVWKWTDKLAQYEQKLLERALKELKKRKSGKMPKQMTFAPIHMVQEGI